MADDELKPCIECGSVERRLSDGREAYPHRRDLFDKPIWFCSCGAFVGCHPGTTEALGAPAGQETRTARRAAHAVFDPLWQAKIVRDGVSKKAARGAGYRWLSEKLGIAREDCHISHMDAATARRVTALCDCALTGEDEGVES